jgi:hypothetical protein
VKQYELWKYFGAHMSCKFESLEVGERGHSGAHSRLLLDGNIIGDISTTISPVVIDVIIIHVYYSFSISISLTV